ncbi:hypothetical protein LTR62_002081 [Meristemomyces frigidus]|uniref:Nuclear pore complex protein n=1 Tax=Meristemomyces frigidus TaxID=1508187 RepID=A0AAN7TL98_9PEZI|nr:hypothetical protein LTR62_002081 [Meristemomyces frigidus]
MPPHTRLSSNTGIGKAPAPRRQRAPMTRKSSRNISNSNQDRWDFTSTNNDDRDIRESVEDNETVVEEDQEMPTSPEVEEAVAPLRQIADRVGSEVESFAVQFAIFLKDVPARQDKFEAAKEIVSQFEGIAKDAANSLQRNHQKERMELLRKEWSERTRLSISGSSKQIIKSSGMLQGTKADAVEEARQWQQEADIWRLFNIVLDFWYDREERRRMRDDKLARASQPHRYTPEKQLWERFLLENEIANIHSIYKTWLEQTVDHEEVSLEVIIQALEERTAAGKGLWKKGWLHTRERIKHEKRMGSLKGASAVGLPQIRSSNGNDLIVSNVDPDAPSRQGRALEREDKQYEQAMWVFCWEMLRRGKSWQDILQWCEEHDEGWRAAILCPVAGASDALSCAAWRKMCYIASQSGCSNEYEAAVYGLLGGNVKAVQKVCKTTDDHLFAHYSCALVRQFELYVRNNFPAKVCSLAQRPVTEDVLDDEDEAQRIISRLIAQLQGDDTTSDEAGRPLKLIESYLLANDVESMANMVGAALSDVDSLRGGHEDAITRLRSPPAPEHMSKEADIALSPRGLRIVTHMYLVLTAIDSNEQPEETVAAEQNVIVAYTLALRAAGKRDFAPTYLSQLQPGRAIVVLARVLQDVKEAREQQTMLGLITEYKVKQSNVLEELLRWTLQTRFDSKTMPEKPLQILEDCEVDNLYPGRRIIDEFLKLDNVLAEDDQAVLDALQWFQLVQNHWKLTFDALAQALRTALIAGRITCAVEIVRRFPYETLSVQKSYADLQRGVNIMDKTLMPENQDDALKWQILQQQSQTYYELEQLVHAIEALAEWVTQERPYSAAGVANSTRKKNVMDAKIALDEAMAPLLSGLLLHATDEEEQSYLDQIRAAYLPEMILAYTIALYTSGPTLSRDGYIGIMDLSVTIASHERNRLATEFTKAGRMRELVQIFAQASKMMLVMKSNGRVKKERKDGKQLGLWEIGPQGMGSTAPQRRDVS